VEEHQLSAKDFKEIYEKAVLEFNTKGIHYKQTYEHFLTKCLVTSFLSFLQSKHLQVRDGKIYAASKEEI
jgi:hypothetical protein